VTASPPLALLVPTKLTAPRPNPLWVPRKRLTPFVQRLLAHGWEPVPEAHPLPALPAPQLPEVLTRREHEILALLPERWSDKEIAARLVFASNTVRKHTSTIFGKLGVSSRREAVDAARSLGLLP
jgi:ATP/maltotriose-dependent transcriptional regulator MalT